MAVYVQERLKTAVSAASRSSEIKISHNLTARLQSGYGNRPLQPDITVPAYKFLSQPDFIAFKGFRAAGVYLIRTKSALLCVEPFHTALLRPSAAFQLCGALSEFLLIEKHSFSPPLINRRGSSALLSPFPSFHPAYKRFLYAGNYIPSV